MPDVEANITQVLGIKTPPKFSKSSIKYGVLSVASLIIILVLVFTNTGGNTPLYTTQTTRLETLTVTVTAIGSIEPTNLVEISSELSGTLASVNVDYNDVVAIGQVLATLDVGKLKAQLAVQIASLDAAIAQLAISKATLIEAREKYESGVKLVQRGVTSRHSFITQKAAYARAQAQVQAATANQALAKASLVLQQTELEKSQIVSPINGVVLDRRADVGQIVASSLSAPILFSIAEDLAKMELQVDIDEADIGKIKVGDAAKFMVEAYDTQTFPAEISEVRYASQTISGVVTYKAILTVDNTDLLLRPGMTATADIIVATHPNTLTVPNAALRYTPQATSDDDNAGVFGNLSIRAKRTAPGNRKTLWVLRDGQPEELAIQIGATNGKVTQILSGNVQVGDKVITAQGDRK